MGEILDRSLHIDGQIALQYSTVETMRVMFEEVCQMISRWSDLCTCPQCVRLSAHHKPVLLYANIDFWVAKPGADLFIKIIFQNKCNLFYFIPFTTVIRFGMRRFRGWITNRRSMKVTILKPCFFNIYPGFSEYTQILFCGCSPASWFDAAKARE